MKKSWAIQYMNHAYDVMKVEYHMDWRLRKLISDNVNSRG